MNKTLLKDILRSVKRSMSRYISVVAIVALGISFFAGMSAVTPDMKETAVDYYSDTNIIDIQAISTIGLTPEDVTAISNISGIETVVPQKFVDGMLLINGTAATDLDGSQNSVRVMSLDINAAAAYMQGAGNPSYMNRVTLLEGTWPTAADQCLVDESALSTPDGFKIGTTISVDGDGADLSSKLVNTEFTIVGIIRTPVYISYERGNTTVGNGKLSTFIYVPEDNFTLDYYPMLWCKVKGSENYTPYTEEYDEFIEPYVEAVNAVVSSNVSSRAAKLRVQYSAQVMVGEQDYNNAYNDAQLQLAQAKQQLEELRNLAQTGDEQIAQLKAQYNEAAMQANTTIDSSKLQYSAEYQAWQEKHDKYNEAADLVQKYEGAETKYQNALNSHNVATLQVNSTLATVTYLQDTIALTRSAIDMLNENQNTAADTIIERFIQAGIVGENLDAIIGSVEKFTALNSAMEISAALEPSLQNLEKSLVTSKAQLESAQRELDAAQKELDEAGRAVEQLKQLKAKLAVAKVELDAAERELEAANSDIQFSEIEVLSRLQDMKFQITNAETNLALAKEKMKTADAEYEAAVNETNARLLEEKERLDEAKALLSELDVATAYVDGRDGALYGYEEYGQTIDRTKALAAIFPWIFFIVAALVCLNTMTRMVEEERTQMGTLKALGYTDVEISLKYIIYALSASVIGCAVGTVLGFYIFPTAITKAYGILYDLPATVTAYRWGYAVIGSVLAVGSTVLAAFLACFSTLNSVAASLMRPKAPKIGKRIFLEKIDLIWSKLSFTSKVTVRNVVRSKKRFIMAVMGVMGCTALMLAGFGLSDSVSAMFTRQFTDRDSICKYDVLVGLKAHQDLSQGDSEVLRTVYQRPEITGAMLEYITVSEGASEKTDKTMEVYVVVPQDSAQIHNVTQLKNRVTGEEYTLDDTGVVITEKLAKELKLSAGDTIMIRETNGSSVSVRVSAVVENYTFHYIYMTRTVYASLYGTEPLFNYVTAVMADGVTPQQKQLLAESLMGNYEISAVSFTEDTQNVFENIVNSLNTVVVVLILSAGLLALIVLYNLSNININERYREIATLKVLGFRQGEVSAYIFRENLILSVIGTLLGLVAGVFLHKVVIGVADVDIVMFGRAISWVSFVYSAFLSMVFSLLVNLILIRRLKKIDMVESLKSVE